ncbi:ArnT family glycosyltransferase [Lignipirellula cremea]|uniref:Glycosyltransferase RgtA/B/C/D-like domain-containing protein n=1 Tax=Lignipirellula cremea TaxID=2528010 RepID=A0A518DV52_9BACT|nr:glycosyltransferase family 39 protein [Lignipirellula cremea]QDU95709.1 hypothetical protein Pla8534_35260 [Lignipirellula cremea]
MPSLGRFWILLAVILAGALAVRVGGACWWQQRLGPEKKFEFPDSESYWGLAQAIAEGKPFELSEHQQVFRTPGYPMLLAPLFWIGGPDIGVMPARLLGAVLGVMTVGLIAGLTRRLFGDTAALAAAVIAALYPGAIGMSVFVLAEAAFCPLMILQLWLWVAAADRPGWKSAAALAASAGLVAGFATLVRPSWLLFTPFTAVVGFVFLRQRGRHLVVCGAMAAGLCLAMAPWWVRNYRVTGHFVPTTLQMGASLYDGLNLRADGGSDMRFVPEFSAAQRADDAAAGRSRDGFEYRLDRRLRDAAVAWARENPGQALGLAAIKVIRMWNLWPNFNDFRSWPMRLAVMAGYLPIMLGAVCGVMAFSRRGWPIALCCMPAFYFTCLHVVFVSSIRYRQPAVMALIVIAAAGWVEVIWPRIVGRRKDAAEPPDSTPAAAASG